MLNNYHELQAFDPHFIGIIFGMNCNLRCKLCYVDFSLPKNIAPATAEEIIDFIKRYDSDIGLEGIWWCGYGEVFADPHFIPLLNNIADRFPNIRHFIQTNGTIINELEKITCWKKISEIAVSIDGTEEFHNKNRGSGMFQKTIEFLRYISPLVSNIKIRSIISEQNLQSIPILQKHIRSLFPNNRITLSLIPLLTNLDLNSGPYKEVSSKIASDDLFTSVPLKQIKEFMNNSGINTSEYSIESHDCHFISLTLLKGEIYACCETFYKIGNLTDTIDQILDRVKQAECSRCGNCKYARFGFQKQKIVCNTAEFGTHSIPNQII